LLGSFDKLDEILDEHLIDIIVVADLDLPRDELGRIASTCERRYVDFKVIPSFFQVFVSSLRMQTVSGVPLLGIEKIPLNSLPRQMLKRAVDLVGAIVGLILSAPIIAVLAALVRKESPGPVFYKQVRTGLHGESFTIYKLRSMRPDAESGSGPQWAVAADPRRLRIGAFMREWNLDELPQFWNILIGDMSLVGPRPERPELIKQFEREIPHYNPRHEVRPGLTGWAQVNGLRGNTSLVERIRYDLYYIENWSFWFDIQIMILTFFRRQNAY
jgi:exopolysaccharide biosynthesis polyprenyl glycosylphosphotransferase